MKKEDIKGRQRLKCLQDITFLVTIMRVRIS